MVKATIKGKREPMELEGGYDPWCHDPGGCNR